MSLEGSGHKGAAALTYMALAYRFAFSSLSALVPAYLFEYGLIARARSLARCPVK